MVQKVHKEGSKIIMQIVHIGCLASNKFVKSKTIGPSSIKIKDFDCREMTKKEIFGAIEDFKKAAVRANKAGFDGVQLHAAHGYFLSQFLSPFFNKRKDDYGGSLENRARLILEILQAIRSELGRQFMVTIKLNSDDFIEGGLTPSEMVEASALLEKGGIDAIEISGGTELGKYTGARITKDILQEDEVYYRDAAKLFKEKITVPLILVGGIRSYEVAKGLIEKELADYIALSRPLIREPGLIKRWQSGDTKKATCVSCNRCFETIRAREGMHCIYEKRSKE